MTAPCSRRLSAAALVCAVAWPARAQDPPPDEPLELGIEERVAIRLVLLDFLVRDRRGEIVRDLSAEDFVLRVDGKRTEIATFDRIERAPSEATAAEGTAAPTVPATGPLSTVLVFDYFHMTDVAATLERVMDRTRSVGPGEQHMVVSLGDVLRVEMPFSSDVERLRATLERMREDRGLYGGQYGRLTERRFFDRLQSLFDVLEPLPGRKAVVLFSGPFQPDGWHHDVEHREISARSTAVRATLYPVDTGGLRTPDDPLATRLGGPSELRRLANETGGRMTADTNDIALAWERAREDAGYIYTIGFYDEQPRLDRERHFRLNVRKRGDFRVIYPEFYVIRSAEEERRSLAGTAAMMPGLFESEDLTLALEVLGPHSPRRWRVGFSVEIRSESVPSAESELQGIVRRENGTVVQRFKERFAPGSAERKLFREIQVRPGRYLVSAVLSEPHGRPKATTRALELPELDE